MQTKHHYLSIEPLKSNKMVNKSSKHYCNKANHKDPPIILVHKTKYFARTRRQTTECRHSEYWP